MYFLTIYYVSDTVIGTRDKRANKTGKTPALMEHTFNGEKQVVSETSRIGSTLE